MQRVVRILGIRGIPAQHGGFETFAERLACYLVAAGWRVIVYCQDEGRGPVVEDVWNGVERIRFPISQAGPKGTMLFDLKTTLHAARHGDLCLVLGYNTAVFTALLRCRGIPCLINMDGIEWARAKWGKVAKIWFWLNEWAGCWLGTHLIADHPEIKNHLSTRVSPKKITMIPYGAELIESADASLLQPIGLMAGSFFTLIARAEPENSILEVVRAFSSRPRGVGLAILGNYDESNAYHRAVLAAASDEVRFLGAIYDRAALGALRVHSIAYIHGHQVGGTNPSLVEALGAGNAIIAHDNRFNRWVAGPEALYFSSEDQLSDMIDKLIADAPLAASMRIASYQRRTDGLTWKDVLQAYEQLLMRFQA